MWLRTGRLQIFGATETFLKVPIPLAKALKRQIVRYTDDGVAVKDADGRN